MGGTVSILLYNNMLSMLDNLILIIYIPNTLFINCYHNIILFEIPVPSQENF